MWASLTTGYLQWYIRTSRWPPSIGYLDVCWSLNTTSAEALHKVWTFLLSELSFFVIQGSDRDNYVELLSALRQNSLPPKSIQGSTQAPSDARTQQFNQILAQFSRNTEPRASASGLLLHGLLFANGAALAVVAYEDSVPSSSSPAATCHQFGRLSNGVKFFGSVPATIGHVNSKTSISKPMASSTSASTSSTPPPSTPPKPLKMDLQMFFQGASSPAPPSQPENSLPSMHLSNLSQQQPQQQQNPPQPPSQPSQLGAHPYTPFVPQGGMCPPSQQNSGTSGSGGPCSPMYCRQQMANGNGSRPSNGPNRPGAQMSSGLGSPRLSQHPHPGQPGMPPPQMQPQMPPQMAPRGRVISIIQKHSQSYATQQPFKRQVLFRLLPLPPPSSPFPASHPSLNSPPANLSQDISHKNRTACRNFYMHSNVINSVSSVGSDFSQFTDETARRFINEHTPPAHYQAWTCSSLTAQNARVHDMVTDNSIVSKHEPPVARSSHGTI
ncbi:hypothetical protein C8R44DRAFT_745381 [Mycena epipterygia]|nr:hypothetical protein C8R44DRAFT_745381 [Mycena epipterygia]